MLLAESAYQCNGETVGRLARPAWPVPISNRGVRDLPVKRRAEPGHGRNYKHNLQAVAPKLYY